MLLGTPVRPFSVRVCTNGLLPSLGEPLPISLDPSVATILREATFRLNSLSVELVVAAV